MRGSRDVGALLIVLGLVYALFYLWWLRRSSKSSPAAGTWSGDDATEPAAQIARTEETNPAGLPPAPNAAWAEGTSVGASSQDSPVLTETRPEIGAAIQDSPVETDTRPEIGAAIQDSPVQTQIAPQSQAEAAMPQDGNR